MVTIVSCLSGTALRGRIARKTFVGILQLIVLVSLSTKQTDAHGRNPAKLSVACYGTEFDPPPRCDGGFSVNVRRVTIGSAGQCRPGHCCPYKHHKHRCEAEEGEPAFYWSVMATCHGEQHCDGLRAPSRWTSLTDCDDSRPNDDDESDQVSAKYVKIKYKCKRESPSPRTTTTPDEDLTPEMTTWDDSQTLVMGSRVSDPVTPYDVTTDSDTVTLYDVTTQTLVMGSQVSDPVTLYDVTTDSGKANGRGSASNQVGVAVGVTVAVLVVIGVITAVLVIYFLRRRRKQMETQIGKDAVASQATPVPNSYDNAFYQEVIPSAPPPTPGGTTRDPPPRDPTASSGNPHPSSPGAAQDTDYDLVRSPYALVQRRTSQDSEYDLRLMENPTYN